METFKVLVGEKKSFDARVAGYGWRDPFITSENCPLEPSAPGEAEVYLIDCGNEVSTEEALRKLGELGLRPTTTEKALAFGEQHPGTYASGRVANLGTIVTQPYVRRALCFETGPKGRHLALVYTVTPWRNTKFLAESK